MDEVGSARFTNKKYIYLFWHIGPQVLKSIKTCSKYTNLWSTYNCTITIAWSGKGMVWTRTNGGYLKQQSCLAIVFGFLQQVNLISWESNLSERHFSHAQAFHIFISRLYSQFTDHFIHLQIDLIGPQQNPGVSGLIWKLHISCITRSRICPLQCF